MKKTILTLALCSFAFGLGLGMNNIVFGDTTGQKIAYVNVTKLLQSSKALKTAEEQKVKQTTEMLKWYDNASADIQKQTTAEGKKALVKKYETQLTQKKTAIKDAYAKKVDEIDKQLDTIITKQAKEKGYDLVFRKDSILYGGDDLTPSILPLVK